MLYQKVYNTITQNSYIRPGMTVIAALSGGADSVCLVDILNGIKDRLGFTLECAHLNHNLRGDESDGDERFVRKFCDRLGLALHVKSVDVKATAKGRSIEEAARDARYSFFYELATDTNTVIATAHTQNDNIETFFINLLRGSGARGLCGIPQKRDCFIRPMLDITRDEIITHLEKLSLPYCTDSTNADTAYLRNFIRHCVIPKFKERTDTDLFKSVSRAMKNIATDCDALDKTAAEVKTDRADELLKLHDAILFRVLSDRLKNEFDIALDSIHFENIKVLLTKPQSREQIRGDIFAINREGRLQFLRLTEKNLDELQLIEGSNFFQNKEILIKKSKDVNNALTNSAVNCDKIKHRLVARTRREGDSFIPVGRRCTSKLKKLLINDGVPLEVRDRLTVICDGDNIVFVEGYGVDLRYKAWGEDKNVLYIKITGEN